MKIKEISRVKKSIYCGMDIFNEIKKLDISIKGRQMDADDKKYFSLYLGFICNNNNLRTNFRDFNVEDYMKIYLEDFVDILKEINFESSHDYLLYLLDKEVVKLYLYKKNLDEGNKTLIKK